MIQVRKFSCFEQQPQAVTSTASAALQFTTVGGKSAKMALIVNYGAKGCQVAFGGSGVVAVATASAAGTTQYYIPANTVVMVEKAEAQYFSAICDGSDSTSIIVHAGEGG